jgi:predicted Rossmann fold flavoprotein
MNYHFNIRVHWLPDLTQDEIREWLEKQRISNAKRAVHSRVFDGIPARLWEHLCNKSQIDANLKWADISTKKLNLLVEAISADLFEIQGKTTFKEEFVTCGGVKLSEIDSNTCMSKKIPNLYFAGEVLDVDGITGGFNFQHAWSSGFVAGKSMK